MRQNVSKIQMLQNIFWLFNKIVLIAHNQHHICCWVFVPHILNVALSRSGLLSRPRARDEVSRCALTALALRSHFSREGNENAEALSEGSRGCSDL